ncbi:MAG: methyltransferase domain-containing protein [Cellulomonas sp.]|nr:methyltransferase domain-containing protein [Cellulomonas sp.]
MQRQDYWKLRGNEILITFFLEEDLEGLVFADASFDFVVAFNSLQYAGSFEKALEEAVRVLKPGGKLALAIWDKPENSDAVHVLKAISSLLPPPLPGTPGPFALSEDGRIEAACKLAGLHVETKQVIACPFVYKSLNEGVKSFIGTGPAAAALNSNREEVVIDAITNALAPFKLADDIHFMVNKYLLFVATKL